MLRSRYRSALREARATLVLAVPLALVQLVQMAMGFIDVVMIGRLGPESMAAAVLATGTFYTMMLMCMGVVMAVNPMVAQAVGARDRAGVGRAVRQGLWLAAILAVPLMLLLTQGERFFLLTGQEPATAALAGGYLGAVLWGTFPNLAYTALRGFAEGIGRPRTILLVTLATAGVNVFLNWVLIFGNLGAPALGVVGSAYATAVSMGLLFLGMLLIALRHRHFRPFDVFASIRTPDPTALRELFRLGWPIGITFGLESGMFLAATLMVGNVGTAALAAHQVALNAASVTFMIPLGMAMATTVRVGQALGAGDEAGARRAGWIGMAMGAAVMALPALVFWLRPEWVVWIYTGDGADPALVAQAAALLGVAAVFQLFDGVQVVAGGALRGLKETRLPMLVGALTYWGLGLTTAWWLGLRLGTGGVGVWWGLTLGLAAASLGLTYLFRRRLRYANSVVASG